MDSLWPSRATPDDADASKPAGDVADTGEVADVGPGAEQLLDRPPGPLPTLPTRPALARNALPNPPPGPLTPVAGAGAGPSRGRPPQQGLPQSQPQGPPAPTDSLSLAQLRRIVAEVNRPEPVAYDFGYADTGPHTHEVEEWFVYQFAQWVRLNAAQRAFDWHWNHDAAGGAGGFAWDDADHDTRTRFVQTAIAGVQSNDAALRSAAIGKLLYLVLGRWGDTAVAGASAASAAQLQAIKAGVECLASLDGLPVVWEALRSCFDLYWSGDILQQVRPQEVHDELMNLMTIMYISIQETLNDPDDMSSSYGKLLDLNPSLVDFMLTAASKLRWEEHVNMPQTQIFLLFWKSILLVFGGSKELRDIKEATDEMADKTPDKETITASPLDYHMFRQEIISKYPAYVPPRPLLPLEADNTSLLPPLPNQSSRSVTSGIIHSPAQAHQGGGASILNQPVHIATPAPSPPPSPAIGGKAAKKQNYQTNQNFPFLYPPLDETSNSAGGKGPAGEHGAAVSRKWQGSDIPASILEAGELFSSRVRMTRAIRQMWDERERHLKYERGWEVDPLDQQGGDDSDSDCEIQVLDDVEGLTPEERQILLDLKEELQKKKSLQPPVVEVDFGPRPEKLSERDKQRLTAVENFYREALPHLQSLVIVLLRPILANVTAIVTQQAAQMPSGMAGRGNPGGNGGSAAQHQAPEMAGQVPRAVEPEPSLEEIDAARTREITAKAMTGILVLLLKWLRVSHVLKFEYLTQLLLDSNYIPLVLKLFAHQDIQQVVDSKTDRVENSFFQFCNMRCKFKDKTESDGEKEDEDESEERPEDEEQGGGDESDDSAAPPPIKRRRSPDQGEGEGDEGDEEEGDEGEGEGDGGSDGQVSTRPEVDELGYPVNPLPAKPITDFSRRNFFSLINYLRVMQKICKNKAHRNLLLVQYKSSAILRRSLRVPQAELRLYTLKLFKNQVPYCGRKWRQSNMRVITAIYLHCRPELRDEWLAGSDVDSEVEGALPQEQALRSLTHWRNVRQYPGKIARDIRAAMREEHDFFTRELEKLDVNWADMGGDESASDMDHVEGWP